MSAMGGYIGGDYADRADYSYTPRELDALADRRSDEEHIRRDQANDDAADRDAMTAARRRRAALAGTDPGEGKW